MAVDGVCERDVVHRMNKGQKALCQLLYANNHCKACWAIEHGDKCEEASIQMSKIRYIT